MRSQDLNLKEGIAQGALMASPIVILMFGLDSHLLQTRRWVLESSGYQVRTAAELSAVDKIISIEKIDILILCHSLSLELCGRALALACSRWPRMKSLILDSSAFKCPSRRIGEVLDSMEGPEKLIAKVHELVLSI